MGLEHPIIFMACSVLCRLLHPPPTSAWVALAWSGVSQTVLDNAGAFWRGIAALEAPRVGMG